MRSHVIAIVSIASLAGCALPDETQKEGATTIPHQVVDVLPERIRNGEDSFTGVIIYGDRGYTGLVGDNPYPNTRVNGFPVGKCQKRRAIIIPLAPGPHVVSAHSENNVKHNIELQEGDVAYFRCNFLRIGGILFPPAVLAKADAETAYSIVNER